MSTLCYILAALLLAWQVVICGIAAGEVKSSMRLRKLGLPYQSRVSFNIWPLLLALLLLIVGLLLD